MQQKTVTASAWKQKAHTSRPRLTAMLALPSGAVVEVCRPNLQNWIITGRLPQSLVNAYLSVRPQSDADETQAAAAVITEDPKAVIETLTAVRDIVTATVIKPRIVAGAKGEDEIEPKDVPDEDFFFIYRWAVNGAADVPVQMEGGEMSVDALATFREGATGGKLAGAGAGGQQVRRKSKRAVGGIG